MLMYYSRPGRHLASKYFARRVHNGTQALAATNRITTHYSVVPREDDPRWKGNNYDNMGANVRYTMVMQILIWRE